MSDEVRDMIGTALAGEPALGLEFDQVVADGRKRRTRRRAGALTAAAAGIVTVVAAATALSGQPDRTPTRPAGPASTAAPADPGCVLPARSGGYPDDPRGTASAAELRESGRLTEAFRRITLPLPAGVEADPLALCVIRDSWGGSFKLTGDQTIFVYLRSRGGQPPGECVAHPGTQCSARTLPDGSTALVTSTDPTVVDVDVWRADGTYVRLAENRGDGSKPRALGDDALLALATAPELKVELSGPPVPAAPSDRRAAELDAVIATALPAGTTAKPTPGSDRGWRFRISQGGYKAYADLTDTKGTGSALVYLEAPAEGAVTCGNQPNCEPIDLAGGRKGTLTTTQMPEGVTVLALNARAADGTSITLHTSNAAGSGSGGRSRPTPSLTEADLVRIADLPGLHW
ncbi:hypothetical protein VA596_14935 [Amycolatopsis sp., V23-08]|uniref:LigA protein n=1 Tax=Amycolatopsis heterodermiae TaxID=3110235 RepID=A0ABU5R3Q5_9PSEU|nr:hypothetical protein [Amycolatopsis sp., V23-08]MEA5360840.1 hypothetical protein [Amycolatopsis sp., V23-08]